MRSDAEILSILCRIVKNNTVGNPTVDANTKFADLKFLYKPKEHWSAEQNSQVEKNLSRRSSANNLMYPMLEEFSKDQKHLWDYPDYFSWEGTFKKTKTIQDVCNLIKDGYEHTQRDLAEHSAQENKSAALKKELANVAEIDLDDLLNGKPSWPEVQKFFMENEFGDECYLVQAIKIHLITPAQKKILFKYDLSIEDTLNGRYGGKKGEEAAVEKMYKQWNEKLGFNNFGF